MKAYILFFLLPLLVILSCAKEPEKITPSWTPVEFYDSTYVHRQVLNRHDSLFQDLSNQIVSLKWEIDMQDSVIHFLRGDIARVSNKQNSYLTLEQIQSAFKTHMEIEETKFVKK